MGIINNLLVILSIALFFIIVLEAMGKEYLVSIISIEMIILFVSLPLNFRLIIDVKLNDLLYGISLGIFIGNIFLPMGVCLTVSFKKAIEYFSHIGNIFKFYKYNPHEFILHLKTAFFEEFVWRVTLQGLIGQSYIIVVVIAFFFTIRHNELLKRNYKMVLDFFCFSLFLGFSYLFFKNFIFIVAVHFIRNMGILHFREINGQEG